MMAIFAAGSCPGASISRVFLVQGGGSRKATERVITKLRRSRQDAQAVGGAVRRLSNESKAMQIQTLEHLLDAKDWELALPVYKSMREKDWYQWNPVFHARLVALLAMRKQSQEAQLLESEKPGHLSSREEMKLQVCLIEKFANCGLVDEALIVFQGLQSHPLSSAGLLSHRALLRGYISLDLPHEAYLTLGDMKAKGFSPSLDDYKVLIYSFGRSGHLEEMEKLACEVGETGLKLDSAGFNMILSAYGQATNFQAIVKTLERMRGLNIGCSINTRNAISKSCPTLLSLFGVLEELPPNAASLYSALQLRGVSNAELEVIKELMRLGFPSESVVHSENVWELNLHGMFVETASLVIFLWLQQLRAQSTSGLNFPLEAKIVTGWGKHRASEGRSVLKEKMLDLLHRMKSPFRADSNNQGVIVSGGSSLKIWLTTNSRPPGS